MHRRAIHLHALDRGWRRWPLAETLQALRVDRAQAACGDHPERAVLAQDRRWAGAAVGLCIGHAVDLVVTLHRHPRRAAIGHGVEGGHIGAQHAAIAADPHIAKAIRHQLEHRIHRHALLQADPCQPAIAPAVKAAITADPHRVAQLVEAEHAAATAQRRQIDRLHVVAAQHADAFDGADPQVALMVMLKRGDQAAGHARHVRDLHMVAVDAHHALLRAGPDHALGINADRTDVATRHAVGCRVVVAQVAVAAEPVDPIAEGAHPQITIRPLRQAQDGRCLATAVVQRHGTEPAIRRLQVQATGAADPQLAISILEYRAHVVATEPIALGVAAEQRFAQAIEPAVGAHPDAAFGILAQADHASARQVQAGRQSLQAMCGDAQQALVLGSQPQVTVPVLQHRGHVQLARQAVHQHQLVVLHPVQALTGDDPQRAIRRTVGPRQATAGTQPPCGGGALEHAIVVAQHQPVQRTDPDPVLRVDHQPGEAHRHRQVRRRRLVDNAAVRRQVADALAFVQQPQPPLAVHLHGLDQHLRRIGLVLPDPPLAITATVADVAA